jgi:2-hydroxychromene-2-carboxylate isomerase
MTDAAESPLTAIEVFADIWCPFAHVGLRRFVHQRWTAGRGDLALHVRAWPLELVNGEPLDAHHVAEQIEDLQRQVTPHLFSGFDPDRFPLTTLPALDLVSDAYAVGPSVGERASLAVRDALFERGEDIGDASVLGHLRTDLALPPPGGREQVLADWAEGQRRAVVGSPHFFIGDTSFFCPALRIVSKDGNRHIRIDTERFDEFFASCLAA